MQLRLIAFYLPQFHPIPENNEWWGPGFTEWHNVVKAKPIFPGHYQPHLPADLGFYDLRLPEAREEQARLARTYGINAFCYYHYWFNGRRILERPFNDILATGNPDFPFCLCWANENWTRAWDGGEKEVLLTQTYSDEDDIAHIRSLIPAFRDPRYIRINDRPLFLVYRTENMPDAARTAALWRDEARRAGVGEIYLARVESFRSDINPSDIGFDAAVEFAPDWRTLDQFLFRTNFFRMACRWSLLPQTYLTQAITRYDYLIQRMLAKPKPPWKRFRCATPGFDNSARRSEKGAAIYHGSSPELYKNWLSRLVNEAMTENVGDERIVFINAWNEWAEGNHLEPDQRHGHAYLEATRAALSSLQSIADSTPPVPLTKKDITTKSQNCRSKYWSLIKKLEEISTLWRHILYWQGRKICESMSRQDNKSDLQ
jgi:lipopolysaccharide biosynthesis protein